MTRTWYTADLHFGHAAILGHCDRPWDSVEEMNDGLVERWNHTVRPDDAVWVLGDVALSTTHLPHVARLNGHKRLVAGNHDACWSGRRRQGRARRSVPDYYAAGFEEVHVAGVVHGHRVAGQSVVLSHLPYIGDHTDVDRFADQRPADRGLPLLCGHVHTAWRVSGRQINVGVDVWGWGPVAEEDLTPLLAGMYAEVRGGR